jgi:hypothetical protein
LLQALLAFLRNNNLDSAQMAAASFRIIHRRAGADARAKLKAMSEDAGLTAFPDFLSRTPLIDE